MGVTATKELKAAGLAAAKEIGTVRLARALQHLHDLLPLKERQESLERPLVELHRAILHSLVEQGRPLTRAEIAKKLGSEDAAAKAVALLGSYDLIVRNPLTIRDAHTNALVVLDAKGGDVLGAYPITTEETPHKVSVNGNQLYAMCAVDALAVGAMFNTETLIQSNCHVTEEPVTIRQRGKEILEANPPDVRVGVRWQRLIDCCAHVMCRQMIFLRDEATAQAWLNADPVSKELFTVPEAILFGEAFFTPLLED
jgi:mercuric reductase